MKMAERYAKDIDDCRLEGVLNLLWEICHGKGTASADKRTGAVWHYNAQQIGKCVDSLLDLAAPPDDLYCLMTCSKRDGGDWQVDLVGKLHEVTTVFNRYCTDYQIPNMFHVKVVSVGDEDGVDPALSL